MDLSFVCGQVRALESQLLDVNRLDRMVGAQTPEEAFRVLVELQYSEYFDESTTVGDFSWILQRGLVETKQVLYSGVGEVLELMWRRFDVSNLKRALKRKFVESFDDLGDFTEDNGYSFLGDLSEEDIRLAVFEGDVHRVPELFRSTLLKAEEILGKDQDMQRLEHQLDRVYFEYCVDFVERADDDFLKRLVAYWADSSNLRLMARSLLVHKAPVNLEAWVKGGSLFPDDGAKVENFSQWQQLALRTDLALPLQAIEDRSSGEETLVEVERTLGKAYYSFLHDLAVGSVGLEVVYNYFEQRLRNAKMIKFVMFAKFHGLEDDQIYATLKHF